MTDEIPENVTKIVEIGKTTSLDVVKHVDFGLYLDGGNLGEVLLPTRYLPENPDECAVGETLKVFIYLDSEDRVIATTETPFVEVDGTALLEVVETTRFGAFLDWGLRKDLFVPFKEQRIPMKLGYRYVVYLFVDNTDRICGSSVLSKYLLEENEDEYSERQEVSLLIASRSELGYKAIINGTHLGLVHNSEVVRQIEVGDKFTGFIGEFRDDGKINLRLQKPNNEMRHVLADVVLNYLEENGGWTDVTDKSKPDLIYETFCASKSNYKKAVGKLYKARKITFKDGRIFLADKK